MPPAARPRSSELRSVRRAAARPSWGGLRAAGAARWLRRLVAGGLVACGGSQGLDPPAATPAVSVPAVPSEPGASAHEPAARPLQAPATVEADACTAPAPDPDDQRQHTVKLHPPREPRSVVLHAEGATITFGFGAFEATARCRKEDSVLAYLAAHPERALALDARALPDNRFAFVIAALLDRGLAAVVDDTTRAPVETLVREGWDWVGCGGGCRQSGRAYRLRVPGAVLFRTTDLFEDSF